jgi:hypothetical protein
MKLNMNSSQEETFQTLTDYLAGKKAKVLISNKPNLIVAEFGIYFDPTEKNTKGIVEASISKTNNGSCIKFNFNFTKSFIAHFSAIAIIGGASLAFASFFNDFSIFFTPFGRVISLFFLGPVVAFVIANEFYSVSKTKKAFIAEFALFAKSLQNRRRETQPTL